MFEHVKSRPYPAFGVKSWARGSYGLRPSRACHPFGLVFGINPPGIGLTAQLEWLRPLRGTAEGEQMSNLSAGDPGSTASTSAGTPMGTGTALSAPTTTRDRLSVHSARRGTTETKPAFKTTEFIAYLCSVAGVLIASAVIDEGADGQGFGAERAWLFITMLTIGYLISRGLAKAGSYDKDNNPRT